MPLSTLIMIVKVVWENAGVETQSRRSIDELTGWQGRKTGIFDWAPVVR